MAEVKAGAADSRQGKGAGRYQEYWRDFGDVVRKEGGAVRPKSPTPDNWLKHSIGGTGGFYLVTTVSIQDRYIGVDLLLEKKVQHHFLALQRDREAIDGELGEQVKWVDELEKSKQITTSQGWLRRRGPRRVAGTASVAA